MTKIPAPPLPPPRLRTGLDNLGDQPRENIMMALHVHWLSKKSKLSLDVKILGLWAVGIGWKEKDEKESENLWSENFRCDFRCLLSSCVLNPEYVTEI